MELINENIILNSENIIFKINKFKFEKKILINKTIGYPSIINYENKYYIYYREDNNINEKPDHEITKRYIIKDIFDLTDDEKFSINLGIANHNLRLFNINNNIYGVGGQSLGIANYNEYTKTTNEKYIEFNNKNDIFINSSDYGINDLTGPKIFNPYIYCPYHANGL